MRIATVIGKLETERCAPGFEDVSWLQVRQGKETTVVADPLGAQPGQLVLLAEGRAAGGYRMDLCTDALVVAVLGE